ncbi:MAG: hypothetical protein J5545_02980 [Bacteroidaceae bacterium]|nr:hypothetical protein [Bacteroidaceae bacterium]
MNAATLDFIRQHAQADVRRLALSTVPEDVDLRAALTQIEGRQSAAHKLPTWAATDGLLFPPRLALEQCSSEATAAYKRRVVEGFRFQDSSFMDLTGGLGIDFTAIAPLFQHAIYVERQEALCELARHNFPLLGLPDAEVRCTAAEETIDSLARARAKRSSCAVPSSLFLFLDPARRDSAGRKVALIEDCSPDVCALQHQLRTVACGILIKLSPMLDLTAALHALHGIVEVHVVSVEGECKELLLLIQGHPVVGEPDSSEVSPESIPIHCVNLTANASSSFIFTRQEEEETPLCLADALGPYLYEPNASILKAGAFKTVCQRFPVRQLAQHTHLYTADQPIRDFPGRCWRVLDSASFNKKDLRRLLTGIHAADLTVRGFPTAVGTLRRQLHLREGGGTHLIATTLINNTRILLRVERL